jgi:hypothetical protein
MQKISVVGLVLVAIALVFGTGFWFMKGGQDISSLSNTVSAQSLPVNAYLKVGDSSNDTVVPVVTNPQSANNPQKSTFTQNAITNEANQIQGNGL